MSDMAADTSSARKFVRRDRDLPGRVTERAGLMPWAPFWLALGIGLWFSLPVQPGLAAMLVAVTGGAFGVVLWRAHDLARAQMWQLTGFALMLFCAGFCLTGLRAWRVDAPVLNFRYYGPVEGRIIEIDRSSGDKMRLTLDQVRLQRMSPDELPRKLRISLPEGETAMPSPGTRVMLTGHLGPPPGPAEPGGFDFRRTAWFEGLGAVGYTRAPVMVAAPPEQGGILRLHRLRMKLSAAMRDQIGGQAGAVSSALMTGDRSGISEATNRIMRDSNLYHIVSISGLHMGMLAGFVYGALRLLIVAAQALTRRGARWPAHKVAAVGALVCAGGYLWLSGGGVATERAFLMVAVMLGAILADRRALSLRTVALAAVVILALAPEALMSPGFQMSFAATVALIVSYPPWLRIAKRLPWLLRPLMMLIGSSVLAGFATSPIAAAHFGRMAHYGVLANLLVVPITGVLIMPMGPLALLLAPLGLQWLPLWVMGLGTRWMLWVGTWISSLGGAVSMIVQPSALVIPLMGAGAVIALLSWRRDLAPWRNLPAICGMSMLFAAATLWIGTDRPALLISGAGDAVSIMSPQGRVPSKQKGGGFAVSEWLEKDGDATPQSDAAGRPGWTGPSEVRRAQLADHEIIHLTGKGSDVVAQDLCDNERLLISDQQIGKLDGRCTLIDELSLRQSGAISGHIEGGKLRLFTTAQATGERKWSNSQPSWVSRPKNQSANLPRSKREKSRVIVEGRQ